MTTVRPFDGHDAETCLEGCWLDCCKGKRNVCWPFVKINDDLTSAGFLTNLYGIVATLFRLGVGISSLVFMDVSCVSLSIYCILKGCKETVFWIVVLCIHNRADRADGRKRFYFHRYLVVDGLVSLGMLLAVGIYILLDSENVFDFECAGHDSRSHTFILKLGTILLFFLDTGLLHVAVVLAVVLTLLTLVAALWCLAIMSSAENEAEQNKHTVCCEDTYTDILRGVGKFFDIQCLKECNCRK